MSFAVVQVGISQIDDVAVLIVLSDGLGVTALVSTWYVTMNHNKNSQEHIDAK